MANFLLTAPPMTSVPLLSAPRPMMAPYSKSAELEHILRLHSSRFKSCFSYTPPMSSPKPPLSLRFSSKQPITSVLKEHKGFVVNKNSSAFWAASFWGDLMRRDEEVRGSTVFEVPESRLNVFGLHNLWAAKEDSNAAVAETEDDTQVAKSNFHKTTGSSSDGPSKKIDRMIVGTSICAVVVIFCFVLPKQQALRGIAVPEQLFRSMEKILYGFLYSHPLRLHLSSISMENFMFYSAPAWLSFLFLCYQYSVNKNIGKMGSKRLINIQSVTFDDVEGCDAAKTALLEAVLCMKGDTNYSKVGAEPPKGVLLVGPPGTGKTLLARAVAGEAGVPFFCDARKHSPSIIYIDEIDAVGGDRGNSFNSERDHTLNQILAEMDGFEKDENVLVIAATNRAELLDPALTGAGRFSRKVFVGKPDEEGRRKIFGLYLEKVPMKEDKQAICRLVASRTRGLVGADLENIAKDSRLLAGRRGGDFVTKEDVLQAVGMAKTKICKDDVNICCIL